MKITAGLALMPFLAGCVVSSVYPSYTARNDVFDPTLVCEQPVRCGRPRRCCPLVKFR